MPYYEYQYTRGDGVDVVVGRANVHLDEYQEPIDVVDEDDGRVYTAERIMSLTANMHISWEKDTEAGDLPPVDASPEDVRKMYRK